MCGADIYSPIYALMAFKGTTFSLPSLHYKDSGLRGCDAVSSRTMRLVAQRYPPEALNPQKHHCESLNPCTLIYEHNNLLRTFVCCTRILTMLLKSTLTTIPFSNTTSNTGYCETILDDLWHQATFASGSAPHVHYRTRVTGNCHGLSRPRKSAY